MLHHRYNGLRAGLSTLRMFSPAIMRLLPIPLATAGPARGLNDSTHNLTIIWLLLVALATAGPASALNDSKHKRWVLEQISSAVMKCTVQFDKENLVLKAPGQGITIFAMAPDWNVTIINTKSQQYFQTKPEILTAIFQHSRLSRIFVGEPRKRSIDFLGLHCFELTANADGREAEDWSLAFRTAVHKAQREKSYSCICTDQIQNKPASEIIQYLNDLPRLQSFPLQFLTTYDRGKGSSALLTTKITQDNARVQMPSIKGLKKAKSANALVWENYNDMIQQLGDF
jgi:hypothetical protein